MLNSVVGQARVYLERDRDDYITIGVYIKHGVIKKGTFGHLREKTKELAYVSYTNPYSTDERKTIDAYIDLLVEHYKDYYNAH